MVAHVHQECPAIVSLYEAWLKEEPRNDQLSTIAAVQWEVHVSVANGADSRAGQEVTWTCQTAEPAVHVARVSTVHPVRSQRRNAMAAVVEAKVHRALAPDGGEYSLEAYADSGQDQN